MTRDMEREATRGRVLAIDYGDKRIGFAVSDPLRMIASPAGFITRRPGKRPPVAELIRQAEQVDAVEIVMGLPLDGNGDETTRSLEVREVGAKIESLTGLRVTFVDERYTTSAALRSIQDMEGTTRNRKGDVDALAATILLQHALRLAEGQA